jgi:hypothetical protein
MCRTSYEPTIHISSLEPCQVLSLDTLPEYEIHGMALTPSCKGLGAGPMNYTIPIQGFTHVMTLDVAWTPHVSYLVVP